MSPIIIMATITTTNILLVYADSMEDIMALIIMTHIIPIFIGIIMTLIIMAFLFITPIHGGIDHTDIATGAGVGTILTIIITAGVILIIAPMVGVILTTMDMADMAGDITTDTTMVLERLLRWLLGWILQWNVWRNYYYYNSYDYYSSNDLYYGPRGNSIGGGSNPRPDPGTNNNTNPITTSSSTFGSRFENQLSAENVNNSGIRQNT